MQLGQFDQAGSALTDVLKQNLSPRRRGGVLTDLAILGIQRNDLDQALACAEAATGIIAQTGSGYVVHKLATLQPYLRHYLNDGRARTLHEHISMLTCETAAG